MAIISMKALLEAGVHFGHRRRRWNPKMKPYIFTERNGIHIIDLQQTLSRLESAYSLVRDTVGKGGSVLFVGTKKQAQETIAQEATRCSMPYVNQRWLGGTLTIFRTIRQRIDYMLALEKRFESGEITRLTKKEILLAQRELDKLHIRFGGLRPMTRLPALVFVVDVKREEIGIQEANTLEIPVAAMVDTNCNPDSVDHIIPSNDDAIRAIKLITSKIADAALEGLALRSTLEAERAEEEKAAALAEGAPDRAPAYESEDAKYIGEATLAKLRSGLFTSEDEEDEDALPAEPENGGEEFEDAVGAEPEGEEAESPATTEALRD